MRRLHCLAHFTLLVSSFILLDCSGSGNKPPKLATQDPLWSKYISGHTAGMVSRKSKVRVLFVNDVVSADKVGKDASSVMQVSPSVAGSTTFVSSREIAL